MGNLTCLFNDKANLNIPGKTRERYYLFPQDDREEVVRVTIKGNYCSLLLRKEIC